MYFKPLFHLDLMIIFTMKEIAKMPNFDVFSHLDIKKRNKRSHGKAKMGILNENIKLSYLFLI